MCKCKNKYIYVILHGNIKQCKCKSIYLYTSLHGYEKQCKQCDFYLGRGDFIMFLMMSHLNGPLQKKNNYLNMHPQLIHMTLQESMVT
jgi:hypothetical protein